MSRTRKPSRDLGDVHAAGPLPQLGPMVGSVLTQLFLAAGIALGTAKLAADFLANAYGDESIPAFGAAVATVGGHPGVAVVWVAWLLVGLLLAHGLERATRRSWVPAIALAALSALPLLAGSDFALRFADATTFGLMEAPLAELAATNIPSRVWVLGLVLGLGWFGARRNDKIVLAAAFVAVAYATFELGLARYDTWGLAVEQVAEAAASGRVRGAEESAGYAKATWAILARSVADLILLLGPIATVRTLTERSLGAFGAAQWRELRLPPPGDSA